MRKRTKEKAGPGDVADKARALFREGAPPRRDAGGGPSLRLALVGMMGAGKSKVGRLLASRLGLDFVDLDREIERAIGKPVARIFAEDGESYFRDVEAIALSEIAYQRRRAVFALGGGAVTTAQVRAALQSRLLAPFDATVWLTASPATLARRLASESRTPSRPLLAGLDAKGRETRLAALLDVRRTTYDSVADLIVDTDGRAAADVAEEVARLVGSRRVIDPPIPDSLVKYAPPEIPERPVIVERGSLALLGRRLRRARCEARRLALVADEAVLRLLGPRVESGLRAAGFEVTTIPVPRGEASKTLPALERTLTALADARLDRSAWVVALGGGAASDHAGFAAATYLRGVEWVAVPTTLLGMVDAALGGKTGLDLGVRKNLVGAFHEPSLVIADPEALATLPAKEIISGLGEVWKTALLGLGRRNIVENFAITGTHDPLSIALSRGVAPILGRSRSLGASLLEAPGLAEDVIASCAAAKLSIVASDPRETLGKRKVLNFGHTLGHALESAAGLRLPHGACVAYGMRAAIHLSRAKGLLSARDAAKARAFLDLLPLPPIPRGVGDAAIMDALASDKKFKDGRMLFVLLEGIGRPRVDVEVTAEEIPGAIDAMRGRKRAPARGKRP